MSFYTTFSKYFDHPPPFVIPQGADDQERMVVTDPTVLAEELFELLGATAFQKLPPQQFLCAAIRGEPPTVTFFLMIIDGERYFFFREQIRDVFNANANPENCHKALVRMYGIFNKRSETKFKMVYSQGTLTVNGKTLGGG